MAPAGVVSIRIFQNEDFSAVLSLFRVGMEGNWPLFLQDFSEKPVARPVVLSIPVVGAVLGTVLSRTGLGVLGLLGMTAALLATIPVAGALYVRKKLKDYVEYSLRDDLVNAETLKRTYTAPGQFWVAELDGEIVGIVALQDLGDGRGELRRMSVKSTVRGKSVGRLLAQALIDHARAAGFKSVELTTTSAQRPALALYRRMGWVTTKVTNHAVATYCHLTLTL